VIESPKWKGLSPLDRRDRVLEILIMSVTVAAVLWAGDWITAPLPIPALTMSLGGLIGLWLVKTTRINRLMIGSTAGLIVGVALHLWSHYAEGRMNLEEGLLYHLVIDTSTALLIAVVALGIAFLAQQRLRLRSGSFRKSHESIA
jgi:hypothetical protein